MTVPILAVTPDMTALASSFVAGIAVPWVTELLTKAGAPDWIRSLLTGLLSILAGLLATTVAADFASLPDYLAAIGMAWFASGRTYATQFLTKQITQATAGFGVGRTVGPETERL